MMIYEIIQHRVLVIEQHQVLLMVGWIREHGAPHNTPDRTRKQDDE